MRKNNWTKKGRDKRERNFKILQREKLLNNKRQRSETYQRERERERLLNLEKKSLRRQKSNKREIKKKINW